MQVNIKYKKIENQGFYNEVERELTRIPLNDEYLEIDNKLYAIDYVYTDMDFDRVTLVCHRYYLNPSSETYTNSCIFRIAVSCSIQRYNVEDVINVIENKIIPSNQVLCQSLRQKGLLLINGFLPKEECIRRNLDTKLSEYLEDNFSLINFYDSDVYRVRREEMVEYANKRHAVVYIIGEIEGGVKEDFELYQKAGIETRIIPLEPIELPFEPPF